MSVDERRQDKPKCSIKYGLKLILMEADDQEYVGLPLRQLYLKLDTLPEIASIDAPVPQRSNRVPVDCQSLTQPKMVSREPHIL